MKVRAVLFDATGVLIELAAPVGRIYAETARAHGAGLPEWRLEDAFRRVIDRAPPRVFPDLEPADIEREERAWWRERVRQTFQAADSTLRFEDFDSFFDDVFDRFAHAGAWRARPGAKAVLAWLRDNGIATGVVSNFDHRLPQILEELGIARLIDATSYPAHSRAAKPDPAAFLAVLAALDVAPHEALYVGHDPDIDVGGAIAAGLTPIEVSDTDALSELPAQISRIANLGG